LGGFAEGLIGSHAKRGAVKSQSGEQHEWRLF
jgi:hypothetical protein